MPKLRLVGRVGIGALVGMGLGVFASAQQQDVPRLRISTTAVEIDSVVTDKQGRHVGDLRAEEFELYQDGRRQKINSVRYVALGGASASAPATSLAAPKAAARREDARRTLAIVVDDLSMSFTNMAATRRALQTFVERDIAPCDLVAVIHAGHDGVISEPFTSDKRVLQETIGRLRYNLMSTANVNNAGFGRADQTRVDRIAELQTETFTIGALGAVNALVRAMRDLPGRKAVILATDGFSLTERGLGPLPMPSLNTRVIEAVKRLVDDANRSFVVMHTIDTRRLVPPDWVADAGVAATSSSFELTSAVLDGLLNSREDGPEFLARAGGGLYLRRSNDLVGLFAKVLEDQRGYYLLTYEPDDQTFQREDRRRPKFHSVKVKVTRPGVRVRARSGFFGVTDEDLKAAPAAGRPPASARSGFVPESDLHGGQPRSAELAR
jgi:VWFA-related protein